jgi:hypothetical protein
VSRDSAPVEVQRITCDNCGRSQIISRDMPAEDWWSWHAFRGRIDRDWDDDEETRRTSAYDFCSEECVLAWFDRTCPGRSDKTWPQSRQWSSPHVTFTIRLEKETP